MTIIFDGNYLLHKTFSVFVKYHPDVEQDDLLKDKERVNQFYRKFLIDAFSAINKVKEREKVIFAFDNHSWRHYFHDDYKHKVSKNKKPVYGFYEFLDNLCLKLRKKGFIVTRLEDLEADDVICLWNEFLSEEAIDHVIISGDNDLEQLVNDYSVLFNNNSTALTVKYKSNYRTDTFDDVRIKAISINPNKALIKKLILGDSGDNVPGVWKGFGEKSFDKFYDYMINKGVKLDLNEDNITTISEVITHYFMEFKNIGESDNVFNEMVDNIERNIVLMWLNKCVIPSQYYNLDLSKYYSEYGYNKDFTLESYFDLPFK